jgi:hypothetical protein
LTHPAIARQRHSAGSAARQGRGFPVSFEHLIQLPSRGRPCNSGGDRPRGSEAAGDGDGSDFAGNAASN